MPAYASWARGAVLAAAVMLATSGTFLSAGDRAGAKFKVTIQDDKPVVAEPILPIDPVKRVQYQPGQNGPLSVGIREEANRNLHLSHFPAFLIDGQLVNPTFNPNIGGKFEVNNAPLPKTPGGKERMGFTTVWVNGDLRIVMTAEVVPTRPAERAQKRRLDAVLVRYVIENKGTKPRKVGFRAYIDTYIIQNDGALFAAPTFPNKLLDGIELKGKTLPDYVQVLERPDLKSPGFVAHLTLSLGGSTEKASRVVLTRHGLAFNGWDMQAVPSMGDSGMGIFWDPKDIPAGGKRDVAYAYGQGVAMTTGHEGLLNVQLGGSFEPGKVFSVAALINDPVPSQTLALELPPGMQRVEGKEIQSIPTPGADQTQSIVLWKARVLKTGTFPIRVHSSNGVTQTKIVTISKVN